MSQTTLQPLPPLPIELKKEILRFCDQATLAITSRVSLEFLQLSSPLLYKHIELVGPDALSKLINLVADRRHTDLNPYLDLSLIHSLTYIDDERIPFTEKDEGARSRLPGRLPLQLLRLRAGHGDSATDVLYRFDPVIFQASGAQDRSTGLGAVSMMGHTGPRPSGWTRIREISFFDVLLYHRPDMLVPNDKQDVEVSYGFSVTGDEAGALVWAVHEIDIIHQELPQIREVIVRVRTDAQRTYILGRISPNAPLVPQTTIVVDPQLQEFDPRYY